MQYSIVTFNELSRTKSFRIDAEYYRPVAIEYENIILNKLHGESISEIGCSVVSGPFGSSLKSEAYLDRGVPLVRISDLRDFLISTDELIYISPENHARLSSSQLLVGDIVLSKVGNTIGVASIVTEDIGPCNISENNIGIRMPKDFRAENKSFMVTYLNSKPGQHQILRAISGNAQPKLNVADIEEIKVPHVSDNFACAIHETLELSKGLIIQAETFYAQANIFLLKELGLANWQPKHQLTFIKNYSDTKQAQRIDAEYFQPKYDDIINAIKSYKGGWDRLENLVTLKNSNFTPKEKKTYQYIELANISGNSEIKNCTTDEGQNLLTRARRKVNTSDIIVSSIEGSLSSIAIIEAEYNNSLC